MTTDTRPAQTATLPEVRVMRGVNRSGEKEEIEREVLCVFDGEDIVPVVDVRVYMARRSDGASPKYATVWVRPSSGESMSGSGTAGGYGYCKSSAAVGKAIRDMGIRLELDIEGRGMSSVREAMHAIANAVGYADCHVRSII